MGSQATSTAYTAFTGKTFVRAQGSKKKEGGNYYFPFIIFFPLV